MKIEIIVTLDPGDDRTDDEVIEAMWEDPVGQFHGSTWEIRRADSACNPPQGGE
jgi:hypothetical protein